MRIGNVFVIVRMHNYTTANMREMLRQLRYSEA